MLPHIHVHSGSNDHWRFGRQIKRGQKIVGYAIGEFRDDVCGRRRNHERINLLGHCDVFYGGIQVRNGLSARSEEHTSELQSRGQLVCRLLLEKKKPPKIWVAPFMTPAKGTQHAFAWNTGTLWRMTSR